MNPEDLVFVIEVGKKNRQLLQNFVRGEVKSAVFKEIDDYMDESSLQRKMFLCMLDMTEKKMMDYIPNNQGKFKGLRRMKNLKILIYHNEKNEFFNFSKFFKSFLKVDVHVTPLKHDALTQDLLLSHQPFLNQWIFSTQKQPSTESVGIHSKEKAENRQPKRASQQPATNKDSPKENTNQPRPNQQVQVQIQKDSVNFQQKLEELRREQSQQIRSLNQLIVEQQLSLSQLRQTLSRQLQLNQQIQALNSIISQQQSSIRQLRMGQSEMQQSFLRALQPLTKQINDLKQQNLTLQSIVSELQSRTEVPKELKQTPKNEEIGVAEQVVKALTIKVEQLQNQNLTLREDKLKFEQKSSRDVELLTAELSALRLILQQKQSQKQPIELNSFNQFKELKSQIEKMSLVQKTEKQEFEQFKGQLRDFIMPLQEKVNLLESLATPVKEVVSEILQ